MGQFLLFGIFPPLPRSYVKTPFEESIEEAKMDEAALFGNIDDLGAGIAQERECFEQAQFHAQGGYGQAEMHVKQPADMSPTATEPGSQIVHREVEQFGHGKPFEDYDHVRLDRRQTGSL